MISIREDAVAQLDRFKGRIPGLFDNTLRIDPLDREQARQAIVKPIATYNQKQERPADPVRFEPALVDAVLKGVKAGAIDLETQGRGKLDLPGRKGGAESDSAKPRIEAPYLQVVMTRIWDEESRRGSSLLRLETFQHLGGAVGIVQKHLDEVLRRLSWSERAVAEEALTYLVTPSGTKIALEPSYLAEKTGHSVERIASVLDRLASSDCRVLRKLDSSGQTVTRYEIFHDVLARVVVDDYVPRIKRRRFRSWLIGMAAALLLAIGLFGFAGWEWWQAQKATNIAQDAYKQVQDAKGKIETQARVALSRQLGLQVETSLAESYPRALLLGAEALYRDSETWEARGGLMRAVNSRPGVDAFLSQNEGSVSDVAFAADGKTLAAGFSRGRPAAWCSGTWRGANVWAPR